MPLRTLIRISIESLRANPLRSLLSMLGIIIGVAAVIAMLAVGQGAQQKILSEVSSMGADLIMVNPGQPPFRGVRAGAVQTLVLSDCEALIAGVPEIRRLSPVVRGAGQLKFENENTNTTILGVASTYFAVRSMDLARGRAFTQGEVDRWARVAVLGAETAQTLFGETDPVGRRIMIRGKGFEVLGVLVKKGSHGPWNPDDQVVVPYPAAMKHLLGKDSLDEVDLQIDSGADLADVERRVTALLRKRHGMRGDEEDDFHVRNMAEVVETASSVTGTFTALLGAVAAISLIVGGIGIMNVMLVTVTERIREIGIRKAIGATRRDVLLQFLFEAFAMSMSGGLIGIVLGVGAAALIARLSGMATVVHAASVVLSMGFSAGVGIFFGWYPARRAAFLDPIDCLRSE